MNYFDEYVKKFDMNTIEINYKYHHSYRVMDNMVKIAKGLNLNKNDIELAKYIGLLHDIGRFEQFSKHKTFKDIQLDHGDYGVKIIKENDILKKINIKKEDYDVVYTAIRNHNKYIIEDNLKERELLFTKMIRDADKLDIIYVLSNPKIREFIHEDDSKINEKLQKEFYKNKPLKYNDIKTNNDSIIVFLAYIYDINFNITFKIINDNKYYEIIYNNLKNKDRYIEYYNHLKEYLKERVD